MIAALLVLSKNIVDWRPCYRSYSAYVYSLEFNVTSFKGYSKRINRKHKKPTFYSRSFSTKNPQTTSYPNTTKNKKKPILSKSRTRRDKLIYIYRKIMKD